MKTKMTQAEAENMLKEAAEYQKNWLKLMETDWSSLCGEKLARIASIVDAEEAKQDALGYLLDSLHDFIDSSGWAEADDNGREYIRSWTADVQGLSMAYDRLYEATATEEAGK